MVRPLENTPYLSLLVRSSCACYPHSLDRSWWQYFADCWQFKQVLRPLALASPNPLIKLTIFTLVNYFKVPYFIEYSVHVSIVHTLILQPFLGHYLVNPKPFLRYLPSIVRRQNLILISSVKKCALYLIKYSLCY